MPACPGKIVVISFCRGIPANSNGQLPGIYTYDVSLNDISIGTLMGGSGSRSDDFIGDPLAILPTNHPQCPTYDHANTYSRYTFNGDIIVGGTNTIKIVDTVSNNGGQLNGGFCTVTRYDISSGGVLTNPIILKDHFGWTVAGGSSYIIEIPFDYFCDAPLIIIDPGTTTTTTINPTDPPPEGCCGCLLIPYEIVNIEDVIFTLPGIALGEPLYLSTTMAPDIIALSINISTTTPTPTTYAPTTTINPIIQTTIVEKQCKCGEVGCNALKF